MPRKKVDDRIQHLAFNATIGCGRGADDGNEPDQEHLDALARVLGRGLTNDDLADLTEEWRKNQAMMENP